MISVAMLRHNNLAIHMNENFLVYYLCWNIVSILTVQTHLDFHRRDQTWTEPSAVLVPGDLHENRRKTLFVGDQFPLSAWGHRLPLQSKKHS